MKLKISFRLCVIILFLGLYLSSLFLMNNFSMNKLKEIQRTFQNLDLDFSSLEFKTEADKEKAKQSVMNFQESLAIIELVQAEARTYSSILLLFMMTISISAFIAIFNFLTKPLHELEQATAKIREGDFSVFLPENGISEMKQLKQSFNNMSRELEKSQKKLLIAEKEMIWKELSRILAHEIKNPLTPIQLSVQRLEEKFETDPERFRDIFPEAAIIIHQEVGNLRELVQSFSNFAKIQKPAYSEFDPVQVIHNILRPYQHSVKIEYDLLQNHMIKFDQTHFYQIITNLFQNAMDVTSKEGKIYVSLTKSRSYLVLSIRDEGQGIKSEDLTKIFEPYFSRKKRGTGLGLALVKRLVEANQAIIRVKSKINEGSEFQVIMEEINADIDH